MVERGERKQTVDEVSKADEAISEPGDPSSGMSSGGCPIGIRHVGGAKLDLAFRMERENLGSVTPM